MIRVISDIILILIVFLLPWWVSTILALALFFYFEKYYELIVVAFIFDSLYGTASIYPFIPYLLTIISILITLVLLKFKKNLFTFS